MEDRMEDKKEFIDGLNTYYKLKESYESSIKKDKKNITKLKDLSWKEKRAEFAKLKYKCINCNRPVGSIFTTKIVNSERELIALCGDRKQPCPLDIKISLGFVSNLEEDVRESEDKLKDLKRSVIFDKNDLLFGYITAEKAVENFDIIKELITDATKMYEFNLQAYLNVVDNDEKKETLKQLQIEFYNNIDYFNTLVKQFETSQNSQFIVDAVDLYVNTMQPRMASILSSKYAYNAVEYNEDENTYHLIQIPIGIDDMEWDFSEKGQKVDSLRTGLDAFSKKKSPKNRSVAAIPGIKEKEREKEGKPKNTKAKMF